MIRRLAKNKQINYPILVNGIVASGCIYAGTNPSYTAYELTHTIRAARVKFLVAEPEILPNVLEAAEAAGIPHSNILIFDNLPGQNAPSGFESWRSLLQHGEGDWEGWDDTERNRRETAARLFSSGTTGLPKAAVLSHANFSAQHVMINDYKPKNYKVSVCPPW